MTQGYDLTNYFMQARRVFALKAAPRRCIVQVTADSRYKLFVNGRFVASGPARGYQSHWPYDEVDVAPYLKRGQNVVAALVHSYGHGTHSYVSADTGGFILRGAAGGTDFSTGAEWRVRRAPGYRRHFTRVSTQLGYQEFFDARVDDGSWVLPTYVERGKPWTAGDTRPVDSVWRSPDCRPAGVMPWPSVEPRGMAMLREEVIAPKALVAECEGASASGWRDAANLTELYLEDRRDWREPSTRFAATKAHAALAVPKAATGRFRSYILDFGREVVGSLIIEATGAAGGEVVDTQVFETMRGLQPDVISPQLDCKMAFANRLTLEKGATRHEQFERWGFGYAAITVRGSARTLKLKVSLRTAMYPLDVKAEFRSSDRLINDIYRISVRTEECCMIDAYVDCPWREQAQWWGDARVQAANTFHLAADARVLKRGIRITAGQEVPNGLTYGMTPTVAHGCILPDYTLTWVMTHLGLLLSDGRQVDCRRAGGQDAPGARVLRGSDRRERASAVRQALLAIPRLGGHIQKRVWHGLQHALPYRARDGGEAFQPHRREGGRGVLHCEGEEAAQGNHDAALRQQDGDVPRRPRLER